MEVILEFDPTLNRSMFSYYKVRDGAMKALEELESQINTPAWNVIERRINEFLAAMGMIIEEYYENPELDEQGWREVRRYASILEHQIAALEIVDVDSRYVDDDVLYDDRRLALDLINDLITINIPNIGSKLDLVIDLFNSYIDYNYEQVKNEVWTYLIPILDDWYQLRLDKKDVDEGDLEQTYRMVHQFIYDTNQDIESILNGSNRFLDIESYMYYYNDRLFDAISGRDIDTSTRRNIDSLDEPHIELLSELRWRSDPNASRIAIENQLQNLRDYNQDLYQYVLSTGIELEDIVKNFNSISKHNQTRQDLELILASK